MAVVTVTKPSQIELITEMVTKEINTPRGDVTVDIHISDLGYCMKKSVLSKADNDYKIDDEKTIHSINDGLAWHKHMEDMYMRNFPGQFLREHEIVHNFGNRKLIAHPDLIDLKNNMILEFKTCANIFAILKDFKDRSKGFKPKDEHVWQLKSYMAIMAIYDGKIIYHPFEVHPELGEKEMYEFDIQMTEIERQAQLEDIFERVRMFLDYQQVTDPKLINVQNVVTTWDRNWQCLTCPYATDEVCPKGKEAKKIRLAVKAKQLAKKLGLSA